MKNHDDDADHEDLQLTSRWVNDFDSANFDNR